MNKYYIASNGCAVLLHETERISKFFRINGWEKTVNIKDADIVLMTCCGVTQNEEDDAIKTIAKLYGEKKEQAQLIVSGCLPSFAKTHILNMAPEACLITNFQLFKFNDIIKAQTPIELVYFNTGYEVATKPKQHERDKDKELAEFIDNQYYSNKCQQQYAFNTLHGYIWQNDKTFQIKVSYGCPGNCSYCATKLGIGNFRSVAKEFVLKQFQEGINAGYRSFLLIGDEIGSYGVDFGENIVMLLESLYKIDSQVTISIRYIHPDILVKYYEQLRPFFSCGYVNYFCCAIQSGSAKILKSMNRNPNLEPFIRCMEDINKNRYPINKHTQVIIGFPDEQHEDFVMTLEALLRCSFDHININLYSPRRGTRAYLLADNIPLDEKKRRYWILKHILTNSKEAKMYRTIKSVILK